MAVRGSYDGAKSLAEFRSQFLGGSRPSLWKMDLRFPSGATGTTTSATSLVGTDVSIEDNSEKLTFDVSKISIPKVSLDSIPVWFMGRELKFAGDRKFDNISITIRNDRDWSVRTSFEQWMAYINGHSENVGATSLNDYAVDITITQLDRDGRAITTYTLVDAFPLSVSEIGLDYSLANQIEEFTVEFAYQWWTRDQAGIR